MNRPLTPRITLGRRDHERLQRLVDQQAGGRDAALVERLDQELSRARVVEQAPPDVVAMNSTVVFEDVDTGARREVRLCYPQDARREAGCVSVLAPIGSALLGLCVGQSIDWEVPGGRRRLRIVAVPQPEAAVQPAA
jgi:regulator of nucleoside diphosphate kinase